MSYPDSINLTVLVTSSHAAACLSKKIDWIRRYQNRLIDLQKRCWETMRRHRTTYGEEYIQAQLMQRRAADRFDRLGDCIATCIDQLNQLAHAEA